MNGQLWLCLWFGVGVIGQSFLSIRKEEWAGWKFFWCFGASLLVFIPYKHAQSYDLYVRLLVGLAIFSILFAQFYKEQLLPRINEAVLLSYSLTFWYAFFSCFYQGASWQKIALLLFLLPSFCSVFIAFTKVKLNPAWKIISYVWFLVIVTLLGLFQFRYGNLSIFADNANIPRLPIWEAVLTGMAFMYLWVKITYILDLVPLPLRNQSWGKRMRQWRESATLLTQYFSDDQLSYRRALFILLFQGGFFLVNYRFHFLGVNLVVNLMILLPMGMLFFNWGTGNRTNSVS